MPLKRVGTLSAVPWQSPMNFDPMMVNDVDDAFEPGARFNFFPYSSPQMDALMKEGRAVSDLEPRAMVYEDATRLLMDDSPSIARHDRVDRVTTRTKVHGRRLGSKAWNRKLQSMWERPPFSAV